MAKQILYLLVSFILIMPDTVLAINGFMPNSPLSMKRGVLATMRSDRLGIMRRTMCAHVETISLTQSLIGLPVGTIAGIVGSLLGVGGGVIMVRNKTLPKHAIDF